MLQIAIAAAETLEKDEIVGLHDAVGWTGYTRDAEALMRALAGSHRIVTARNNERLIGLARSIPELRALVRLR